MVLLCVVNVPHLLLTDKHRGDSAYSQLERGRDSKVKGWIVSSKSDGDNQDKIIKQGFNSLLK